MGPLIAVFLILLVALVGGALLQLAVAAANRLVGPGADPEPARAGDDEYGLAKWDWDDWDDDYADTRFVEEPRARPPIPKPGLGVGAAVTFLTAAVCAVAAILIAAALDGPGRRRSPPDGLVALFTLPVGFLSLVALLVGFLPTTFRRAALVAAMFALMVLAFLATAGVLVFVLAALFR